MISQNVYLSVHVGHDKKTWVLTLITHVLKRKFGIFNIAGGQFRKPPIFTKGNPHLGNLYMTQIYITQMNVIMKSGILFFSAGSSHK